jgi:hypothetical protein
MKEKEKKEKEDSKKFKRIIRKPVSTSEQCGACSGSRNDKRQNWPD